MPLKFLVDTHSNKCIKDKGCEAICKNYNNLPEGIYRIRVITINEGKPGQLNIPMPCLHCNDPPCMKVCPTKAIYKREDGIVLVNKTSASDAATVHLPVHLVLHNLKKVGHLVVKVRWTSAHSALNPTIKKTKRAIGLRENLCQDVQWYALQSVCSLGSNLKFQESSERELGSI